MNNCCDCAVLLAFNRFKRYILFLYVFAFRLVSKILKRFFLVHEILFQLIFINSYFFRKPCMSQLIILFSRDSLDHLVELLMRDKE